MEAAAATRPPPEASLKGEQGNFSPPLHSMLNWRLVTCSWHVFTNPEFIIFQSCNVFFFYYVQQKNIHFFHKKIHTKCLWNIFVDGGFVKVFDEHVKVQVFWEGHKNLANLPLFFWQYLVASNYKWKMSQTFVTFSEYPNFKQVPKNK